jgi:polyisoprenyl-teichoic acid--peptidoglycan teichoic acid transferase
MLPIRGQTCYNTNNKHCSVSAVAKVCISVECSEAQRLIEQGVSPGSHAAINTRLGFHLASCANCRAYRTQHSASNAPPPAPRVQTPAVLPHPIRRKRLPRVIVPIVAGLVFCVLLFLGNIAWRTNANLDALAQHQKPQWTQPVPSIVGTQPAAALPMDPVLMQPVASEPAPTPWPTLHAAQPLPLPTAGAALHPTPAPGQSVTILLLGSDLRPGETSIPRTDAIILVRVDPQVGRVAMLSLPRDLWVSIPGYGENRLNSAYLWGEHYGQQNGLELARQTVSNALGINVDYVALINFEGFVGLVDHLGGITVNVKKALYDPRFPTSEYGTTRVSFAAGRQSMDGARALIYSRIRHPDSDFERMQRQQDVLLAIAEKLRQRGNLANVLNADQLSGALVGYVQTTIPKEQLLALGWSLRSMQRSAVKLYYIDEYSVTRGVGSDRYALTVDPAALQTLVKRFVAP